MSMSMVEVEYKSNIYFITFIFCLGISGLFLQPVCKRAFMLTSLFSCNKCINGFMIYMVGMSII